MFYTFLLIFAGLFGLDQILRPINGFARTIVFIQVLYIMLTLIAIENFKTNGYFVAIFAAVLVILYGLSKEKLEKNKRMWIVISALPILIVRILAYLDWPYIHYAGLSMIIPISVYLFQMLPHYKQYASEFGFMTIMAIGAFIRFSKAIDWLY
jgi:hypothetical protein